MNERLSQAVMRLRQAAPELNKSADEANHVIQFVERFLNEDCRLYMPCRVLLESTPVAVNSVRGSQRARRDVYLVYDKIEDSFQIGVRLETVVDSAEAQGSGGWSPQSVHDVNDMTWSNVPRHWKLTALAKVPELIEAIARMAVETSRQTKAANEAIAEIMSAVSRRSPKGQGGRSWSVLSTPPVAVNEPLGKL